MFYYTNNLNNKGLIIMAKTSKFTQTLLASALAVVAGSASAAAFQLAEVSTSGLGRAYAGKPRLQIMRQWLPRTQH